MTVKPPVIDALEKRPDVNQVSADVRLLNSGYLISP